MPSEIFVAVLDVAFAFLLAIDRDNTRRCADGSTISPAAIRTNATPAPPTPM
jgi:hypothetical protein